MPPPPATPAEPAPPGERAPIVEFLRRPETHPGRPEPVELCETHISWVFLAGDRAYKLKKPVKFEFLDFSTPELRRHACQEELRLNRRLAPKVYQDVVPITREPDGKLALAGSGPPVDWVVVMQRLADDDSLEARLAAGQAHPTDLENIARRLARFYAELPPLPLTPAAYRAEIERHVRGNLAELLPAASHLPQAAIRRVHTAQLAYLLTRPEVFDRRVTAGHVVEGHGDLRPEHIYLTPEPVVIDCIEFNAEFRHLDRLDELCFLAMECTHRGHAQAGAHILTQALAAAGDQPPAALRAFYTAYRACVRAKVSVLRAAQLPAAEQPAAWDDAARYLELAAAEADRLGPPRLLLVRGPAGVGKTTVAAKLAERLALVHLSTDAIRRELFGPEPTENSHDYIHDHGRYSPENRRRVYDELFDQAERDLAGGASCVLDGTFLTRDLLQQALELARTHGAAPLLVDCDCPPATAAARIARRAAQGDSLSAARAGTHVRQRQELDPPPSAAPQLSLDTSQPLENLTAQVLAALSDVSP